MKAIFLGTPDFAVPSLEALLKTPWIKVLAVCTQTDKESGRGQKVHAPPVKILALEKNIRLFQTKKIKEDKSAIELIKSLNPDILITCAFGQILNQEILDIAPYGTINIHASLLPKYRGAAPINWAILNGESETGITIMKTAIGLDSGPVLLQKKCTIGENETSIDLSKKLSLIGGEALISALKLIKDNDANYIPQDPLKATKAPMLKKELGLIDWSKTTLEIHNKIRGLQPWPSAFTYFRGCLIKLWDSRGVLQYASTTNDLQPPPGTITELSDYLRVKTSNGFIDIYKLQPENKKIIGTKDWINGAHVKIGEKFGICV